MRVCYLIHNYLAMTEACSQQATHLINGYIPFMLLVGNSLREAL